MTEIPASHLPYSDSCLVTQAWWVSDKEHLCWNESTSLQNTK